MSEGPEEISVDALRAYVRERSASTSIRAVAQQIGVGHSTLYKFIGGSTPRARVRARLLAWYVRERRGREPAQVAAARALLSDLPRLEKTRAVGVLADSLEYIYATARQPSPGWLVLVRKHPW
jgi:predicted transcriptional regulator